MLSVFFGVDKHYLQNHIAVTCQKEKWPILHLRGIAYTCQELEEEGHSQSVFCRVDMTLKLAGGMLSLA